MPAGSTVRLADSGVYNRLRNLVPARAAHAYQSDRSPNDWRRLCGRCRPAVAGLAISQWERVQRSRQVTRRSISPVSLLWAIPVVLATAALGCAEKPAAAGNLEQATALADAVARELSAANASAVVSKKFHIPESYSSCQRSQEVTTMVIGLDIFLEELGSPANLVRLEAQPDWAAAGILPATIPYWESLPNLGQDYRFFYAVAFEKEGEGFIAIDVVDRSDRLEVRGIDFGFPLTRADAGPRIGEIFRRMAREIIHRPKKPCDPLA